MRVKKNNKPIIFCIIVVVIIIIIVIVKMVSNNKKVDYSKLSDEELDIIVANKIQDINKIDLSNLNERERMEYYVSEFITAIENKNYETAYQMLNDDFKNHYFPNYSDFEEYAKNKFPSNIALNHTNIERNGDIYVLWVTVANQLAGKKSGMDINFVIKENDLNDFELSFSVK